MKHQFELLAPGGDLDAIKAAIVAGADAIYCGLDKFNARNRATNISFEVLNGVIALAHQHQCKIFLTLNIIFIEDEVPALIRLFNQLVNTDIDGVILQDLGAFYLLSHHFPTLDIHASTQMNTHNEGQVRFVTKLTASRVNLSRELNIDEIKQLTQFAHRQNVLTEVFVHGSYCIGFSGLCYLSSAQSGNSGNRGRCSQPCRDQYVKTPEGNHYPLNLKDNSAFSDIKALHDAGVDSLKVEGRIKQFHYVYTVVNRWRDHIDAFEQNHDVVGDNRDLYRVFNRGFSNGYLQGDINKSMFVDNPRDNSLTHLAEQTGQDAIAHKTALKQQIYDQRTDIIEAVKAQIDGLTLPAVSLLLKVSGSLGTPLTVTVCIVDEHAQTQNAMQTYSEASSHVLTKAGKHQLDLDTLTARLKGVGGVKFPNVTFDLTDLQPQLFVSFKELTIIKTRLAFILNANKPLIKPVELPKSARVKLHKTAARLSILVSDIEALSQLKATGAQIYFQLPDAFSARLSELITLFTEHNQLIPWFPAILIGEDYSAAQQFLTQVKPARIVTNNSGVAVLAYELGIEWVAGPFFNLTNSYSLLAIRQAFHCAGAFISNEINKAQISRICPPDDVELHYSLFHPISLLTSRQCLFQPVIGCKKSAMDNKCLKKCDKSTSIINMQQRPLLIDKQKGGYHTLYGHQHCLNLDIITDLPDRFTRMMIDLRPIKTDSQWDMDNAALVTLFSQAIAGDNAAITLLQQQIKHTTNAQYIKGL